MTAWDSYYKNFKVSDVDFEELANAPYSKILLDLANRETRALEYGCGRATESLLLAHRFGITPALVDLSDTALSLAREYFKKYGLECDAVKADLNYLPFADASFNLVYSRGTVSNLIEPQPVINELARVTAPGGSVVLSCCNAWRPENWVMNKRRAYHQKNYSMRDLTKMAETAGFKVYDTFGYDSFYIPRVNLGEGMAKILKNAPMPDSLKLFVGVLAFKKGV